MKRKTIIAVLVVLIVLLAAALLLMQNKSRNSGNAPAAQQPQEQQAAPAAVPTPEATPVVLQEEELTVNTQAQTASDEMLPVIEAEVRTIYEAQSGYFDIEKADMCWNALARLCSSDKLPSGIAEDAGDGSLKVSKENMSRLAKNCFAMRSELPELPKDMKNVSYDKDSDSYIIKKTDADKLKCEIMETTPTGEGAYSVSVALLDTDTAKTPLVSTYTFDIVDVADDGDTVKPVFTKTVFGGYDVCNVLAQVTGAVKDENGEFKLDIHPVQLHWESEGEGNGEDEEAYVPKIVADTKADSQIKLYSLDMVDWNTIAIVLGEDEKSFDDPEKAWEWFKENYSKKVDDEGVIYQMRVYKDVIYSMAPLYSFYFAG